MLTFKETTEKNRLEISYDTYSDSPRNWGTVGKFITVENRYDSPDKDKYLTDIINSTYEEATSLDTHLSLIKEQTGARYVYPITRYEHGNIAYMRGSYSGWDYSLCGFYLVTQESIAEMGIKDDVSEEQILKQIDSELEVYNSWVNGEVYQFYLYDGNGEFQDACGGFYDIEEIREHLPEEFKGVDLQKYVI